MRSIRCSATTTAWKAFLVCSLLAGVMLVACTQAEQPSSYVWQAHSPRAIGQATQLTAWYLMQEPPDWQANLLVAATEAVAGANISTTITGHNIGGDVYLQRLGEAAAAGTAPDLAYVNDLPTLAEWSAAGYLWSVDQCRTAHAEFANVGDQWWATATWDGQTWTIPAGIEARMLFYNKQKLAALGWSPERIHNLPQRIAEGTFTLDDMLATARQAIATGVVEPGYGFWQRPGRRAWTYYQVLGGRLFEPDSGRLIINPDILEQTYELWQKMLAEKVTMPFMFHRSGNTWSSRTAWHDAVVHGRVLFWLASSSDWSKWTLNYVDHLGGEAYLRERVGYALFPSGEAGTPGSISFAWAGFVILSEQASGRQQQEAACAVLAQTLTPQLNAEHPGAASYLSVIRPELFSPDSTQKRFADEIRYMEAHATVHRSFNEQGEQYDDILSQYASEVVAGTLSPAEAAALAVQTLGVVLGDDLLIE